MGASLLFLYTLVRYDLAHQILPPVLLYPLAALAVLYAALAAPNGAALSASLFVALALAAFLLAIHLLSPKLEPVQI